MMNAELVRRCVRAMTETGEGSQVRSEMGDGVEAVLDP
jgi:hypothetical protein